LNCASTAAASAASHGWHVRKIFPKREEKKKKRKGNCLVPFLEQNGVKHRTEDFSTFQPIGQENLCLHMVNPIVGRNRLVHFSRLICFDRQIIVLQLGEENAEM
jgi:hypothetical protein